MPFPTIICYCTLCAGRHLSIDSPVSPISASFHNADLSGPPPSPLAQIRSISPLTLVIPSPVRRRPTLPPRRRMSTLSISNDPYFPSAPISPYAHNSTAIERLSPVSPLELDPWSASTAYTTAPPSPALTVSELKPGDFPSPSSPYTSFPSTDVMVELPWVAGNFSMFGRQWVDADDTVNVFDVPSSRSVQSENEHECVSPGTKESGLWDGNMVWYDAPSSPITGSAPATRRPVLKKVPAPISLQAQTRVVCSHMSWSSSPAYTPGTCSTLLIPHTPMTARHNSMVLTSTPVPFSQFLRDCADTPVDYNPGFQTFGFSADSDSSDDSIEPSHEMPVSCPTSAAVVKFIPVRPTPVPSKSIPHRPARPSTISFPSNPSSPFCSQTTLPSFLPTPPIYYISGGSTQTLCWYTDTPEHRAQYKAIFGASVDEDEFAWIRYPVAGPASWWDFSEDDDEDDSDFEPDPFADFDGVVAHPNVPAEETDPFADFDGTDDCESIASSDYSGTTDCVFVAEQVDMRATRAIFIVGVGKIQSPKVVDEASVKEFVKDKEMASIAEVLSGFF